MNSDDHSRDVNLDLLPGQWIAAIAAGIAFTADCANPTRRCSTTTDLLKEGFIDNGSADDAVHF
jgi:hypothetical protein